MLDLLIVTPIGPILYSRCLEDTVFIYMKTQSMDRTMIIIDLSSTLLTSLLEGTCFCYAIKF